MKRKDETDKKECPKQRKVPEPEKTTTKIEDVKEDKDAKKRMELGRKGRKSKRNIWRAKS